MTERRPRDPKTAPSSQASAIRVPRRARRYPLANASHYRPAPGRGRDWLSITCPHCGGVHLARLRPGTVPGGPRRTPCGWVCIRIRRTYSPRTAA